MGDIWEIWEIIIICEGVIFLVKTNFISRSLVGKACRSSHVAEILYLKKTDTPENTVISSNSLVWEFCGNSQSPHNFHTKKSGEITVFYEVRVLPKPKRVP